MSIGGLGVVFDEIVCGMVSPFADKTDMRKFDVEMWLKRFLERPLARLRQLLSI